MRRVDADDARKIVRLDARRIVERRGGLQDREAHAVPFPVLARRAAQRDAAVARALHEYRVVLRQRRGEPVDGHGLQDRERAAAVIGVLVRDDHAAEAADARCAQERRDDPVPGVGRFGESGPGIVEKRVLVRLHDDGEPLPDVEHRHRERARAPAPADARRRAE